MLKLNIFWFSILLCICLLQGQSSTTEHFSMLRVNFDSDPNISQSEMTRINELVDSLKLNPGLRQNLSSAFDQIKQNKNDSFYLYIKNLPDNTGKNKVSEPDQNILLLQLLLINHYYAFNLRIKPELTGLADDRTIQAVLQYLAGLPEIDRQVLNRMREYENRYTSRKTVVKIFGQTLSERQMLLDWQLKRFTADTISFEPITVYDSISADYVKNTVFKGEAIPSDPVKAAAVISDFIKSKMKYDLLISFTDRCLRPERGNKLRVYNEYAYDTFSNLFASPYQPVLNCYSYSIFFKDFDLQKELLLPFRRSLLERLSLSLDNESQYFLTNSRFNQDSRLESRKQPPVKRYNLVIDSLNMIKMDSAVYPQAFKKLVSIKDKDFRQFFFDYLKSRVLSRPGVYLGNVYGKENGISPEVLKDRWYDSGSAVKVLNEGIGVCRNFSALLLLIYNKASELNPALAAKSRMTYAATAKHAFNILYFENSNRVIKDFIIDLTDYITTSNAELEMYKIPEDKKRCYQTIKELFY